MNDDAYMPQETGSHLAYQALQAVIAKQRFQELPDSPWPTAFLHNEGAAGIAQLRPVESDGTFSVEPPDRSKPLINLMWSQRTEMSDLDADVLDILSAIWLRQARTPLDIAVVTIDECLRMRGLEPKLSGSGRRGGFSSRQREEFLYALGRIESTWLTILQVESRAFVMTARWGQMRLDGRIHVKQPFIFRPGEIFSQFLFGPGRQTMLLSVKAVQYDYYRHTWEKRLTRYFSWLWRADMAKPGVMFPFKVSALLDCADITSKAPPRFPNRVRERLEKALDTLVEDAVISNWRYAATAEIEQRRRKWYSAWLSQTVEIGPPRQILDLYSRNLASSSRDTRGSVSDGGGMGRDVRVRREQLGLSQTAAAARIGIDRTLLSRIEQNKRNPSRNDLPKIERWLHSGVGTKD